MKIEDSEYFEISGAKRIVFKNGKYSGQTLDEVRLIRKFYLPYLKFRANSPVDKKILRRTSLVKRKGIFTSNILPRTNLKPEEARSLVKPLN